MFKFLSYLAIMLIVPIIFIIILKFYYQHLPGEEIGSVGDWIGFAGGYIGAILALAGIWWQMSSENKIKEREENEEYHFLLEYIYTITQRNLKELENKENSITAAYTFHKAFIKPEDILSCELFYENILTKFTLPIFKNNHYKILELDSLMKEVKKTIDMSYENSKIKKTLLPQINEFFDSLNKELKNLRNKIELTPAEQIEFKYIVEKHMVFQNFISSSFLTLYPDRKALLSYCHDNLSYDGFVTLKDLQNNRYNFYNYTASNRINKKEITATNFFDLYKEYYVELSLVLSIPKHFSEISPEYKDLFHKIDKLIACDKDRENTLKKYKELLKDILEITSDYQKQKKHN